MNTDKLLMKLSSYRIPFSIPLVLLGFFWILSTRAVPAQDAQHSKGGEEHTREHQPKENDVSNRREARVVVTSLQSRNLGIQDPERDRPFEARATAVNSAGTIFLSCKKTVYQVTGQGLKELQTS